MITPDEQRRLYAFVEQLNQFTANIPKAIGLNASETKRLASRSLEIIAGPESDWRKAAMLMTLYADAAEAKLREAEA